MYTNRTQSQHLFSQKSAQFRGFYANRATSNVVFTKTQKDILLLLSGYSHWASTKLRNKTIAYRVGCSEKTVTRATELFQGLGLLTKRRSNCYAPNTYVFCRNFNEVIISPIVTLRKCPLLSKLNKHSIVQGHTPTTIHSYFNNSGETAAQKEAASTTHQLTSYRESATSDNICDAKLFKKEILMKSDTLDRIKIKFNLDEADCALCEAYPDSVLKKAELRVANKEGLDNPARYFMAVCKGIISEGAANGGPAAGKYKEKEVRRNPGGCSPDIEPSKSPQETRIEFLRFKTKQLRYIYSTGYRGDPAGEDNWRKLFEANIDFHEQELFKLEASML